MKLDCDEQKAAFMRIVNAHIHREGIDELTAWLEEQDFFEAPASTRYHGHYPGGLCQHAIDVFDQAVITAKGFGLDIPMESLAIAALFHDLCKVNFYKLGWRSVKVNGKFDQQPVYSVEERFRFGGHGSKSAYLVERHMHLTDEEALAISCHMGFSDADEYMARTVSEVYRTCPLAWVVHVADEAAVYLLDRNGEEA